MSQHFTAHNHRDLDTGRIIEHRHYVYADRDDRHAHLDDHLGVDGDHRHDRATCGDECSGRPDASVAVFGCGCTCHTERDEAEVCANGWSPRGHHSIDGAGVYLVNPRDVLAHGRLHFCTEACRGEWTFHVRGEDDAEREADAAQAAYERAHGDAPRGW